MKLPSCLVFQHSRTKTCSDNVLCMDLTVWRLGTMATSFMPFNKSSFGERCNTIHDLLSHVSGGSITSDCVLIPLLSCVCNLFWGQIQPDKATGNDGLTGSHRLTEIHCHFLFSHVFSHPLVEFRGESAFSVEIRER